ncbi:MAG: hypothetical protein BGO43_03370 [Gammaproteobacteria bacterium 39-13]|nr:hypothetical protein [Gammaproteobacteria bacterium]OJV92053.1 MAG: hypothetical protein BGO43_03370 [Gammaproteobacteria bacterium 39-13]
MEQGPQQSSIEDLDKKLRGMTIEERSRGAGNKADDPIHMSFDNIHDATAIQASTRRLCEKFIIPSNMTVEAIQEILDKLDEQYQENFKAFRSTISPINVKKIAGFQKLQSVIQHSPLLTYIKHVMGLLNHLHFHTTVVLSFEQGNQITSNILNLFADWIELLEIHNLAPCDLHKIMLAYILNKGNLNAALYIHEGVTHFNIWNELTDSTSGEAEHHHNKARFYFEKALEIAHLNQQNLNDFNSHYDRNPIDEINILIPFIYAQSFSGHLKLARENVEKIYYLMVIHPWCYILALVAFDFYARRLMMYSPTSYHEIIEMMERNIALSKKTIIGPPDFDHGRYTQIQEEDFIVLSDGYQTEIADWGKPYHLVKKSASTSEIIYTLPSADFNNQIKRLLPKILRDLPSKQVSISVKARELFISFPLDIPLAVIKQAVEKIGEIFLNPEPTLKSSETVICQDIVPTNPTCSQGTDGFKSSLEATPVTKDIGQNDNEKEKETKEKKEKGKRVRKGTQRNNNKSSSATTSTNHSIPRLQAILETNSPTAPFKKQEFEHATICELQGAKGIFVAYNPQSTFVQPKKLDKKIETRYRNMFRYPHLASSTNCNGFKWISNNMGACLIGKLTRESYRLFPLEIEINDVGETAFFYGEIRNSKKGKKANRYG